MVVCCLLFIDPLSNTNQTIWGRRVGLFVVYVRYTVWAKEDSVCVNLKVTLVTALPFSGAVVSHIFQNILAEASVMVV